MKLRILDSSIRLRLDRSEVQQLLADGSVERRMQLGPSSALVYALHAVDQEQTMRASLGPNRIDVHVSVAEATAWAMSDQAGIEATQPCGAESLRILVEKDFPCAHCGETGTAEKFTPRTMRIEPSTHSTRRSDGESLRDRVVKVE